MEDNCAFLRQPIFVYRHLIQRIFESLNANTNMMSFLVHLVNFFNMPTFSSPPFCFLSHLSLLDERYQTIIQHRITKGNQDCFVRLCGCLFPLWSLPPSLIHTNSPQTHPPLHTSSPPRLYPAQLMHMRNMRVTFAQWYSVVMKIWRCFVCPRT